MNPEHIIVLKQLGKMILMFWGIISGIGCVLGFMAFVIGSLGEDKDPFFRNKKAMNMWFLKCLIWPLLILKELFMAYWELPNNESQEKSDIRASENVEPRPIPKPRPRPTSEAKVVKRSKNVKVIDL